jgi:hypothetical protein
MSDKVGSMKKIAEAEVEVQRLAGAVSEGEGEVLVASVRATATAAVGAGRAIAKVQLMFILVFACFLQQSTGTLKNFEASLTQLCIFFHFYVFSSGSGCFSPPLRFRRRRKGTRPGMRPKKPPRGSCRGARTRPGRLRRHSRAPRQRLSTLAARSTAQSKRPRWSERLAFAESFKPLSTQKKLQILNFYNTHTRTHTHSLRRRP